MSNKKEERAQMKFDVPQDVRARVQEVSEQTGFNMTTIFCMLVRYYLVSPLDVEHDVRRMLVEVAKKNEKQLRLSKRQKEVIDDVAKTLFTDELI